MSAILKELHTKKHTQLGVLYESELKAQLRLGVVAKGSVPPFSNFNDQTLYAGAVPSGKYLTATYQKYHKTIQKQLDRDTKARTMKVLATDGSYKTARRLYRIN